MMKDMYEQPPSRKPMTLHILRSEDGQKLIKLDSNALKEESDCIVSPMSTNFTMEEKNLKKRKRSKSVTQELVVNTKNQTSNEKLNTSEENTQVMKSSKTLDPDSTGIDMVLKPFWTKSSAELSKKLWLATKTDCVDLDMKCLSKSVTSLAQNSWFSTKLKGKSTEHKNCQKTCCPSSPSSLPEIMDCVQGKIKENERTKTAGLKKKKKPNPKKEEPSPMKVVKIQLYPNEVQKRILNTWMGTVRWTYNQCLNAINKKESSITKKELRSLFLNKDSACYKDNDWLAHTPYDVRDEAMIDLIKGFSVNFGNEKKFKMKFRSKRDRQQSIVIHHKHFKHKKGAYAFIKDMKTAEPLPSVNHDSRIILDKLKRYFICIPIDLEIRSENQRPKTKNVISLDPGVRTFMTGYDPSGITSEWGVGDSERICRLAHHYDKCQSFMDTHKVKNRTKRNLKLKMLRINQKIKNIVKDLHCKLAKYYCLNYNIILLPEFKTQSFFGNKKKRKLNSKTARSMVTWAHYSFRQRLINAARQYPWVKVVLVTEDYTSITCGNCGDLNHLLGISKHFHCSCGYQADRDINAARNVLLKYLSGKE